MDYNMLYTCNYTSDEIENIIDNLLDIVVSMVDDTYNCGDIADKASILQYFTDIGFHKEDVMEWYEWLEE